VIDAGRENLKYPGTSFLKFLFTTKSMKKGKEKHLLSIFVLFVVDLLKNFCAGT